MSSPVEKIKERLSIEEVVSSYIKLEKAGRNLKAKCPFHNEKTPSFFVSPERGSYYCFGCGASGDIFTFIEEFEGLDFRGALKLLASRAGVPLESFNPKEEGEKEKLYRIMEIAAAFFEKNLAGNAKALSYLKERGLQDKTIKEFRIGYVRPEWRSLYSFLREKGFKDEEIEKAGLAKKTEKGMYDRFRGRIIFPLCDTSGRVIAFSGRILEGDDNSAKYLNSPDTPIFKKSSVLYGLDKAKQSIKKNDFSIVVEGQFDLILSHQAGFRNTIATSGTALADSDKTESNTVNNLGLVSRLSQNIIFIFDADKAGLAASVRATPIALALFSDMNVKATEIPDGMDPADLISKKGPDAWREVIRNSKHIIEFLLDKILAEKEKDSLKTKLAISNKIIPFLSLINNPVKKSHFISMIADKSGIKESDIRDKLAKEEAEQKYEREEMEEMEKEKNTLRKRDYIERKLLGVLIWQKNLKKEDDKSIKCQKEVIDKTLKDLSEILLLPEREVLDPVAREKRGIKASDEDLSFEAEVFYSEDALLEKDIKEMISNLGEELLKEELERKMNELHQAEKEKDNEKSAEILKECQILNDKIQSIKNGRFLKN